MLDDGRLTDGKGRTVDFRNAVIILTSNLGAQALLQDVAQHGTVTGATVRRAGGGNHLTTPVLSTMRTALSLCFSGIPCGACSNAQSQNLMPAVRCCLSTEDGEATVLQQVRSKFAPEFLNRLDEIVVFSPLSATALLRILSQLVEVASKRPGLVDKNVRCARRGSTRGSQLEGTITGTEHHSDAAGFVIRTLSAPYNGCAAG
eukprot:SAG22_NODE_263_length_13359_cov_3.396531_3_plen_203_part_00